MAESSSCSGTARQRTVHMLGTAVKRTVRVAIARFWAGATAQEIIDTLLPDLRPYFEFQVSDAPQVVLYGPYPGEMRKGHFIKVFIGCENVRPIMSECDWAFGVEHEESVKNPRYMRFMRWGDDLHLVQNEQNFQEALRTKKHFCAFLYAHRAPYREAFFSALSRYKRVDSPGRSMNNMPSIDAVPGQRDWKTKVAFLRDYKFVIAFENSSVPGYNTEKLTHAIEADCLPIYWGDPQVGRSFNVQRFINAHDYLPKSRSFIPRLPYRPHSVKASHPTFIGRAARRFNGVASELEQWIWALPGFDALIERVIQIDRDDELYLQHLRQPFLIGNKVPDRSRWISRWRQILEAV
jgi:alpha(1,3/1,4) fucosyltransferase